jgi:transcriptional regulator with XRE-family HTH domain
MRPKIVNPVARYFGAQVRKHRIAAKLTMTRLASMTGIDLSVISRLESGQANPTPNIARRLDSALYPDAAEGQGHFMELYQASLSWVPAAFRRWAEHEDQATRLLVWEPYTINGLLQTRDYACVILTLEVGATHDQVAARLNDRMDRQQRVLYRDEPPHVWFVVDELSLYRRVGSTEIMADQCAHLLEVAALPHVALTVMPAIEHNANEGGFIIGDGAVYAESAASYGVHTDQSVSVLLAKFASLQTDSYGSSESLSTIKRLESVWRRGVSPLTAAAAGGTA